MSGDWDDGMVLGKRKEKGWRRRERRRKGKRRDKGSFFVFVFYVCKLGDFLADIVFCIK